MPREKTGETCEVCGGDAGAGEDHVFLSPDKRRSHRLCKPCNHIFKHSCEVLGLGTPESLATMPGQG